MASTSTPLLVLIGHLLPQIGSDAVALQRVVDTLDGMADDLQGDAELVPVVQNLLVGLKNNPATTQGQMAMLSALDVRLEASLTAPTPEPDPAPAPTPEPDPAPAPSTPAPSTPAPPKPTIVTTASLKPVS